jgi:hypothetical protein
VRRIRGHLLVGEEAVDQVAIIDRHAAGVHRVADASLRRGVERQVDALDTHIEVACHAGDGGELFLAHGHVEQHVHVFDSPGERVEVRDAPGDILPVRVGGRVQVEDAQCVLLRQNWQHQPAKVARAADS